MARLPAALRLLRATAMASTSEQYESAEAAAEMYRRRAVPLGG
jgi:hypothetical protein